MTAIMLKLSPRWAPILKSLPETGMGYWVATVILRDGRRFDHVTIVGGTISKIKDSPDIPFTEDEIQDITVQGKNW